MTSDIAGHPLEDNIAAAGKGVDEIQGGEEAGLVVGREKGEQAGTEDADDGGGQDDEVPLTVVAHVHGICQSAYNVYSAGGYVEESRSLR